MTWFPAPCIEALQRDLDKAFPGRVKPDWIIGDAAHSARTSDHNPDSRGMVHAIDIRLGGDLDVKRVLNSVIGDPRVWYVIYNRIIYSRTYGWAARAYTGASPHTDHVHVSVRYLAAAEQNTGPWHGLVRVRPSTVHVGDVHSQFRIAAGLDDGKVTETGSVRRVQKALNAKDDAGLATDGLVGKKTLAAFKDWEAQHPGKGREQIPDRKSLTPLVSPKWELVD